MTKNPIFTIGHSTHPLETFIGLLHRHRIDAVADVRSVPFSRWQPQFDREDLTAILKREGVAYVFLGRELGGRSSDPTLIDDEGSAHVSYRLLARTGAFQQGLGRVLEGSRSNRIALMCAEKEPLECHRSILVARELIRVDADIEVTHILADGQLETHGELKKRLRAKRGLPEEGGDLFRTESDIDDIAYAEQEKKIAYVRAITGVEE